MFKKGGLLVGNWNVTYLMKFDLVLLELTSAHAYVFLIFFLYVFDWLNLKDIEVNILKPFL